MPSAPLVSQTFESMYPHHPLRVKEACDMKGWIVPKTWYTHYAEQAMETFCNVKTLVLMASILVAFTSFKSPSEDLHHENFSSLQGKDVVL